MNTLAHKMVSMQQHQEGEYKLNRDEVTRHVRSLINNHATYGENGFGLNVNDLDTWDQLIFVSKLCDAVEYSYHMSMTSRKLAAIEYYKPQMQELIDAGMPAAWAKIQDEIDDWKKSTSRFGNEMQMLADGLSSDNCPDIYRY